MSPAIRIPQPILSSLCVSAPQRESLPPPPKQMCPPSPQTPLTIPPPTHPAAAPPPSYPRVGNALRAVRRINPLPTPAPPQPITSPPPKNSPLSPPPRPASQLDPLPPLPKQKRPPCLRTPVHYVPGHTPPQPILSSLRVSAPQRESLPPPKQMRPPCPRTPCHYPAAYPSRRRPAPVVPPGRERSPSGPTLRSDFRSFPETAPIPPPSASPPLCGTPLCGTPLRFPPPSPPLTKFRMLVALAP